jgi:protein SCO1/2
MRHNARPCRELTMARATRIIVIVCALTLGAWLGSRFLAPDEHSVALVHGTRLTPARSIGSLDLVDQSAQRFTQERLKGRWSVVYFGFTSCPMICPTTMAMLRDFAARVAIVPAGERPQVIPQVIMITVDPERDTPEVIGRYVAQFDPSFLGLTGTKAALDDAAVKFTAVHGPAGADGSIDHSSTIFIVDPQAALAAVFTPPHSAAALAEDYKRLAGG